MPRTTSRGFLPQLRSAGVDDAAQGPTVSDNIQLVYVVDDLSRLIAPRSPVEGWVTAGIAAQAVRVSGIVFRPPPDSAAIVTWMRNDSAIDTLYIVGNVFVLDVGFIFPGVIDFSTGPGPPRGSFEFGQKAVQTAGILLPAGENIPDRHPDIVVGPGQFMTWVGDTINTAVTLTWSWREVPV